MPGRELDLLAKYPRGKRDPAARAREKTAEDVAIARQFGREFFDGDRRHGYGGYSASPERWRGVVADMIETYGKPGSVIDIGCGKGGMLRAFKEAIPTVEVCGIDVSGYAIECARKEHRGVIQQSDFMQMDARDINFRTPYGRYDLAISINTVHNLARFGCLRALENVERVGRRAYITVDTYRNDEERQRMQDWNLTALTILHVDEWREFFVEAGYTGDYGWFMP